MRICETRLEEPAPDAMKAEGASCTALGMATFVMAADLSGVQRVLCKTPTGQLSGTYNSRRDETPGPSYCRCKHSP